MFTKLMPINDGQKQRDTKILFFYMTWTAENTKHPTIPLLLCVVTDTGICLLTYCLAITGVDMHTDPQNGVIYEACH